MALVVKNPPANAGDQTLNKSLGWEHPLEEGMATHSSILAWKILWTEEPGGLQSMESQKSQAHTHTHTHTYKRREKILTIMI